MIKRLANLLPVLVLTAACVQSSDVGPAAFDADYRALEVAAVKNLQCAWENQTRCSHMIENRSLFPRFFAEEGRGGMTETEKSNGRLKTTKFIVETTANINQCRRVEERSILLIKGIKIQQGKYQLMGTAPLSEASSCYLEPLSETS